MVEAPAEEQAHINWLHFSDLRMTARGTPLNHAGNRAELERDLRALAPVAGPWDVVILTGDLTDTGSPREFAVLDTFLESLMTYLESLGPRPMVLAVPGGHDATWRRGEDFLERWQDAMGRSELLASGDLQHVSRLAFQSFSSFHQRWSPRLIESSTPKNPGDFVHIIEMRGQRLGVLGLNSAYAQLGPGDWDGLLDVDTGFAREIFSSNLAPTSPWLLLTHHGPDWMLEETRLALANLLRDRPSLHLFGHARDESLELMRQRGDAQFRAASLLGAGITAGGYGYAAGRADFDNEVFRIWPRRLSMSSGGAFVAARDWRYRLALDESFALPWTSAHDESALALERGHNESFLAFEAALSPPSTPMRVLVDVRPAPAEPEPELPKGITQRRAFGAGEESAVWPAWSPDGTRLASGHADGSVLIWELKSGHCLRLPKKHKDAVLDLAWSPDGAQIATISEDALWIWRAADGEPVTQVNGDAQGSGYALAWHPRDEILTWRALDDALSVMTGGHSTPLQPGRVRAFGWSQDGSRLGTVSHRAEGHVEIWDRTSGYRTHLLRGPTAVALDLAWMPGSGVMAVAYADGRVAVWTITDTRVDPPVILAAHTDTVTSVSFSYDGRLLATKSHDGTVKLWRTDRWEAVASIDEDTSRELFGGLAFSPTSSTLASLGSWNIRVWDIDTDKLLGTATKAATKHAVRAKVVLVGEGNAGKSCLALRLAEDRYADLGATHGMRFWSLPEALLDPDAAPSQHEEREVVLWDLGGQSEYRLVHQLFLANTTVALLVFEPRRGQAALDEIEGWIRHLEKTDALREVKKILVGTKLDDDDAPVDAGAIEAFVRRHGLVAYIPTSAKAGIGGDDLRRAIAGSITWSALVRTSQTALFRTIRREIEAQIASRRVVLPMTELEQTLRAEAPEGFDVEAVHAVVRQLALQGVLADTRLADGSRALVLQVDQIDRYAGSLVILARDNPRGVAAIDVAALYAPRLKLPRMSAEDRLRRDQELVVFESVIQLLQEHGIAVRHAGLLVFPSLFRPTERDPSFSHTVALNYEFAGPVENIYASLVTALSMSGQFGPMRLWEDRAEFARPGRGMAGLRKLQQDGGARGAARLDIYFDAEAGSETRELFIGYVEEHLREHSVEILENLAITCACGLELPEKAIRVRLSRGQRDITCPACEARIPLSFGAAEARDQSPDLDRRLRVMKTTVEAHRRQTITETKIHIDEIQRTAAARAATPIRILHLSDLHVRPDADPPAILEPLAADLEDRVDGLGLDKLDALVVSGDVTNRASHAELEKARELVAGIIDRFGLTAERIILVPGNHDLDWNEAVYRTVKRRTIDEKTLRPGTFKQQGDLLEIRDDAAYPHRFRSFSQHFYHPILQQPYPLAPEQQCVPILCADLGIQFFALNSAWEIDEYFQDRSGVHPGAISRGLAEADRQIKQAKKDGRLAPDAEVLRIAVWHHPVSGNEKIADDAFIAQLQKADVRLCLHGHVHEDRADLLGYLHPTRRIAVAGAGSFGATEHERPESVPRLYNVIEVSRDLAAIRVHTRCLKKANGAWEGWAVWPGGDRGERRTYYEVRLAGA